VFGDDALNGRAYTTSDANAELLLSRLAESKHTGRRKTSAAYLLTGLLKTPADTSWRGELTKIAKPVYRAVENGTSKQVETAEVDQLIVQQVMKGLTSKPWVSATLRRLAKC
jgi:hypothetical protein